MLFMIKNTHALHLSISSPHPSTAILFFVATVSIIAIEQINKLQLDYSLE